LNLLNNGLFLTSALLTAVSQHLRILAASIRVGNMYSCCETTSITLTVIPSDLKDRFELQVVSGLSKKCFLYLAVILFPLRFSLQ
jgi:hypothetical protein